ncbi:MAG: DUF2079 domain-containing protein [Chloroflexi bacterium]|nr:DUF2079 domain-containing protein [Chloroflexota bacterium]
MTARKADAASLLVAAASSAFYFWALHLRHTQFDTYTFDLGLLLQVAWNSAHGRWFDTTILPFNYLAEHLTPSLVLAGPLLLIWPDAHAFFALQSIAIGASGLGIYAVARRHGDDPVVALLLQAGFAVAPSTGYVARDEFHPIALAMPLITLATALAWRRRFTLATLVGGSALFVNEDAALVTGPLGLLIAFLGWRSTPGPAPVSQGGPRMSPPLAPGHAWLFPRLARRGETEVRPPSAPGHAWLFPRLARRGETEVRPPSAPGHAWPLFAPGHACWGIGLAVISVAWLAAYFLLVVPIVRPQELGEQLPHPDLRQFIQCGTSVTDVVRCLLDPSITLARATSEGDRQAVVNLLGPTLGLGLLGASFLVAIPRWLIMLLGLDPPLFQAHYVALLVTAAYLAAGEALGLLRRVHPFLPRVAALGVAAASLYAFVQNSPLPGGGAAPTLSETRQIRIAAMEQAVALVPPDPDLAVAATSSILPHVALRSRVALPVSKTCYEPDLLIADLRDAYPYSGEALRAYVAHESADPGYRLLFAQSDVVVLRKVAGRAAVSRADLFGGALRLDGYTVGAAGERLGVQLFWSKEGALAENYHYFIHLVDPAGATFSQADGQLKNGIVPTREWDLGCPVREGITLSAPPLSEWPRYRLAVGWYDLRTGERLRLPDGSDHVALPLTLPPSFVASEGSVPHMATDALAGSE